MSEKITLDELDKRASDFKEDNTKNVTGKYKLARELGFNSYEANILKGYDEETIRKLAEERKSKS